MGLQHLLWTIKVSTLHFFCSDSVAKKMFSESLYYRSLFWRWLRSRPIRIGIFVFHRTFFYRKESDLLRHGLSIVLRTIGWNKYEHEKVLDREDKSPGPCNRFTGEEIDANGYVGRLRSLVMEVKRRRETAWIFSSCTTFRQRSFRSSSCTTFRSTIFTAVHYILGFRMVLLSPQKTPSLSRCRCWMLAIYSVSVP